MFSDLSGKSAVDRALLGSGLPSGRVRSALLNSSFVWEQGQDLESNTQVLSLRAYRSSSVNFSRESSQVNLAERSAVEFAGFFFRAVTK